MLAFAVFLEKIYAHNKNIITIIIIIYSSALIAVLSGVVMAKKEN